MLKREMRVLGIDDAPFDKYKDRKSFIVGVFYRGGHFLDGVLSAAVTVDGNDATAAIIQMIKSSKFKSQMQAILLDGIAVAGLNVIDIHEIYSATRIPVIVVMRKKSEKKALQLLLLRLGMESKAELIEKAGTIHSSNRVFFQCAGIDEETARRILGITTAHSQLPEAVRVAHLIASGIAYGESRGKP